MSVCSTCSPSDLHCHGRAPGSILSIFLLRAKRHSAIAPLDGSIVSCLCRSSRSRRTSELSNSSLTSLRGKRDYLMFSWGHVSESYRDKRRIVRKSSSNTRESLKSEINSRLTFISSALFSLRRWVCLFFFFFLNAAWAV